MNSRFIRIWSLGMAPSETRDVSGLPVLALGASVFGHSIFGISIDHFCHSNMVTSAFSRRY